MKLDSQCIEFGCCWDTPGVVEHHRKVRLGIVQGHERQAGTRSVEAGLEDDQLVDSQGPGGPR